MPQINLLLPANERKTYLANVALGPSNLGSRTTQKDKFPKKNIVSMYTLASNHSSNTHWKSEIDK